MRIPRMTQIINHHAIDPKLALVDMVFTRLVQEAPGAVDPGGALAMLRVWCEAALQLLDEADGTTAKLEALAAEGAGHERLF